MKGNDTVVSFPDGKVFVDTESKNSLATAGSGDMLCGMIAGLISQGIKIEDSILVSIFLQSRISQEKNKTIVEDFIELIPKTLNLIKKNNWFKSNYGVFIMLKAGVAELVDALGLGSSDISRVGSSPSAVQR